MVVTSVDSHFNEDEAYTVVAVLHLCDPPIGSFAHAIAKVSESRK